MNKLLLLLLIYEKTKTRLPLGRIKIKYSGLLVDVAK